MFLFLSKLHLHKFIIKNTRTYYYTTCVNYVGKNLKSIAFLILVISLDVDVGMERENTRGDKGNG